MHSRPRCRPLLSLHPFKMSGAPRSPRRPPLPPPQKFSSLFAYQRPSPKRSPRKPSDKAPQGKYEQFLAPQTFDNLSSAAPLALNVLYPIGHAAEEESEEEEIQNSDTNSLFERQRKGFLSKYFSQNDKVVVVNLKSERRKLFEPKCIENSSYLRMTKDEFAMSAPLERRRAHTIGLDDKSSGRHGSTNNFSTYNDNGKRKIRPRSLSGAGRRRSSGQSDEGMTDFEFNDSWIDAISMDIDEDVPAFLSNLPDVPASSSAKKARREAPEPVSDEEDMLSDDPVEEALKTALSKQLNTVDMVSEPAQPEVAPERAGKKRQPSAAELNREWGFGDPTIGKYIRAYMRQIEGED